MHPHAAGIDCGSAEHFVAVPPDRDAAPVRSFATFTGGLHRLAEWLTLAPHNKISGGRLLSSRTQPSANRAAAVLRLAVMNLGRTTQTALGAFYRGLAFRVGKAKAITATARKLAILIYRTLKDGLVYAGADTYDAQHRTHVLRRLRQRAHHLGFGLIDLSTGEVVEGSVS